MVDHQTVSCPRDDEKDQRGTVLRLLEKLRQARSDRMFGRIQVEFKGGRITHFREERVEQALD